MAKKKAAKASGGSTRKVTKQASRAPVKSSKKKTVKKKSGPMRGGSKGKPDKEMIARARRLRRGLEKLYPDAHCELDYRDAYQLLVATILSAQCTDVRVNMVTPGLFKQYPSAKQLAGADQEGLEEMIRSTGFFRNKAKSLRAAAQGMVERHGGGVPDEMDALLELAGVARKTANVVLGNAFGKNEGVVVDTHVNRLANRMGLTEESQPEKVELDLMGLFPREGWTMLSHLLIWHGRRVCNARKPDCAGCALAQDCPQVGVS